eukprot:TRINITY_DN9579_c0_g1_i11.p1 TRINITY_DN9579_c0_g1~~TRINITY_DN9579_c0_g1_i11.p1  ORF type:complete len:102 (-),score=24.60 TRINITY_DN9579_c0_g1_i11:499-804(-)
MSLEVQRNSLLELNPSKIVLTKEENSDRYQAKLLLTNISQEHIAVKIKSNAPDIYAVKPKTFVLEPSAKQELRVTLKPSFPSVAYSRYFRICKVQASTNFV